MIDRLVVNGKIPLKGQIEISGAKNSACPIIMASLLNTGTSKILNIPLVEDVFAFLEILKLVGSKVRLDSTSHQVIIDNSEILSTPDISKIAHQVCKGWMVHLEFVIGSLLARTGDIKINMRDIGGCPIGKRPIDLHLKGFEALGAEVNCNGDLLQIRMLNPQASHIDLAFPSVGATGNLMMLASSIEGLTTVTNAAQEPEIVDLANFLNKMGVNISGAGSHTITINGKTTSKNIAHSIIPDRIEAGTFMMACGIASGDIQLTNVRADSLTNVIRTLSKMGLSIKSDSENIFVQGSGNLIPVDITSSPYPGFPTDLIPLYTALSCFATGSSDIEDLLFENRFCFTPELRKFGAKIDIKNNRIAHIEGVKKLQGAEVMARDLRGGTSLVLTGLGAVGKSEISNALSIRRGYEKIDEKLKKLNADVKYYP